VSGTGVRDVVLLTLGREDLPRAVSVEGAPAHERLREPVPGVLLLCDGGIEPDEVHAVGLSHLHLDHAGGLRHFVGRPVHCQRRELEFGLTDEAEQHAIYRIDFDDPRHDRRRPTATSTSLPA
jgi:N-acyl homoserine lactone hydrolase